MPKPLVIVESPAKARTIAGFLGGDYVVEASVGHIQDLPRKTAEVPEEYRSGEMARLAGVDPENDFKAIYITPTTRAREQIRKLKQLLKDASEVYLATDEDREGESIAWHLQRVLNPRVPVRRMVFHEITRPAIERAVQEWREVDLPLVDAQETRRILDRLYGWELSPVLWRKVQTGLSAGRVQSVATRIVVQRERERMAFRAASYWDLSAAFATDPVFSADLVAVDGRRVATGRDFDSLGQLRSGDLAHVDEATARRLADGLTGADFTVVAKTEKDYRRSPSAPFMTSTLQQEAGRKLGFGAQRTMAAAQSLYENGFITYMRTDSTNLSDQAVAAARRFVEERYGAAFVPARPRVYTRKVKNAQEAHEAIRPAGDAFRAPEDLRGALSADEFRVYELVFQRTVASQMADARGSTVTLRVAADAASGEHCELSASGTVITFPGYQRAYVEGADDGEEAEREGRLPALGEGDRVVAASVEPRAHATAPPARYTEASLVKRLEELGVGRPSTYASILTTIQDREYVWKKGAALVPSFLAFAVVQLLEEHFPQLIDFGFTAELEDQLDGIARREQERVPWLRSFYFGNGRPGLRSLVSKSLDTIDARAVNTVTLPAVEDVVVRVGRYGPYLETGDGTRATIPEGTAPDELTAERVAELLSAPPDTGRELGTDPATGLPVVVRNGRFGPYVQLGEQEEGAKTKPRRASLFKDMSPATVSLEEALSLLSLPRVVGVDPASGEEISAQNGRYGPYLKKGEETRSLSEERALFTVGLDEALALFAQPKQYGRRAAAPKAPLRELGPDPATGAPVVIKEGRFGPYITDGEYNVTVPRGEGPDAISADRAFELLAAKRAAGPPATRGRKAAGARKAAKKAAGTKTATAKKAAGTKKATPKKAAGTKTATPKTATPKKAAGTKKATAKKAAGTKKATPKKATAETATAETATAETATAETATAETATAETPTAETPTAETATAQKATAETAAAEQAGPGRGAGASATAGQAGADPAGTPGPS